MEVGSRVGRHIRVAFAVQDVTEATERLAAAGAELVAPPILAPWNYLNARREAPAGLQLTLFTDLQP